jgi:hypothetical protein
MDALAVIAIVGGIALLIGILGGGIEAERIKIPPLPTKVRFLAGIIGAILLVISLIPTFRDIIAKPDSTPANVIPTPTIDLFTQTTPIQPSFTPSLEPTATATMTPTKTPTNTPPPPPLTEIFPQVGGGEKFLFTNSGGSLTNTWATVETCIHSGFYGLQLSYDMKGAGNGGWGIQWDNAPEKHFDASMFHTLTFWVKGTNGGELFQISLKDTNGNEVKIESDTLLIVSSDWMPVAVSFDKFSGVNTASIENVNFGFNKNHGTGTICVDDISFSP